jgi:hypothetical protein
MIKHDWNALQWYAYFRIYSLSLNKDGCFFSNIYIDSMAIIIVYQILVVPNNKWPRGLGGMEDD